jgi:hypothetical protein
MAPRYGYQRHYDYRPHYRARQYDDDYDYRPRPRARQHDSGPRYRGKPSHPEVRQYPHPYTPVPRDLNDTAR